MSENNCGIFHLIIAVVSIDENTTWPQKKQNKIEKGNFTEIEKQHDIQKIDNSLNSTGGYGTLQSSDTYKLMIWLVSNVS